MTAIIWLAFFAVLSGVMAVFDVLGGWVMRGLGRFAWGRRFMEWVGVGYGEERE